MSKKKLLPVLYFHRGFVSSTPTNPTEPPVEPTVWSSYATDETGYVSSPKIGLPYLASTVTTTTLLGNRAQLYGPYWMPESGVVTKGYARITGQTNDSLVRMVVYNYTGVDQNTKYNVGDTAIGSITTAVIASNAVTILANAAKATVEFTFDAALPPGMYAIGFLSGPEANSAIVDVVNGGTAIMRFRSNSGQVPWVATGLPTTFPASSANYTTTVRNEAMAWLDYTPTVTQTASIYDVSLGYARSVRIRFTSSSTSENLRVRLERKKVSEGTWTKVAVLRAPGTSTTYNDVRSTGTYYDGGLDLNEAYHYRVVPVYYNADGTPSATSSSVTVTSNDGALNYQTIVFPTTESTTYHSPLRGNHGGSYTVPGTTITEVYRRQFNWIDLESTPGNYTFTALDNFITGADNRAQPGQIAIWRWRCYVPGGGALLRADLNNNTYSYLNGSDRVPNWQHPTVIQGMKDMWAALGSNFATRTVLADIGGYNQYGEWTGSAGTYPASSATLVEFVDAAGSAFSPGTMAMLPLGRSPLIMSATNDEAAFNRAVDYWKMGIRQDALGTNVNSNYMLSQFYMDRNPANRRASERFTAMRIGEDYAASMTEAMWLQAEYEVSLLRLSALSAENLSSYTTQTTESQNSIQRREKVAGYRLTIHSVNMPESFRGGVGYLPINITWKNTGNGPVPLHYDYAKFRFLTDTGSEWFTITQRLLNDGGNSNNFVLGELLTPNGAKLTTTNLLNIYDAPSGDVTLYVTVQLFNYQSSDLEDNHPRKLARAQFANSSPYSIPGVTAGEFVLGSIVFRPAL